MASTQLAEQTNMKGFASILGGVSNFGRKAQAIAGEFAKLSEENIGAGTKAAERLREAKSLEDVTTIQTDLLKESFETINSHYQKIAAIAVSAPQEMAASYREFFAAMTDLGTQAANKAGDLTRQMGDRASDTARQTADVASQSADKFRDTARQAAHG